MESEPTQSMDIDKTPDQDIEQTTSYRSVAIKIQKLLIFQVIILIIVSFNCLEESNFNLFHLKELYDEDFDTFCSQYFQCNTHYYNSLYGDQYREQDRQSYNQWVSTQISYLGIILLLVDLLFTLGFRTFKEKLKKIQKIHYFVHIILLAYFNFNILSVIRFEQYLTKTIQILLFQLIVVLIINVGLLFNNLYFKRQIELKRVLQYAINGIAMGLFIISQFTDFPRQLIHQLAISVYLVYYFVQLDNSIQQIEQVDTNYPIWSNIATQLKSIFQVNENYQEIVMNYFVISKKGIVKLFFIGILGILISILLSIANEGVFYLILYLFISTLQTQVQDTTKKNRLQASEEYFGVTLIPLDIIMPARNLLRTFIN